MIGSTRSIAWVCLLVAACSKAPAPGAPAAAAANPTAKSAPTDAAEFSTTAPSDAEVTASGLASKQLKPGSGERRPQLQDKVRVLFTAWNSKGKVNDGSDKRGGPVVFEVSGVIAGWREALQLMRVGERRRLWIPDQLVYPGRSGYPRANSVFELELLEIIEGKTPLPTPEDVAAAPASAIKTASGLAYKLLREGKNHDKPNAWDHVVIHYTGWTADGAMFESSRNNDRPSKFDLAKVMPGWREALPLLAVGDEVRLWIPESLAYQGRVGEPKGNLVFDVELVSIEHRPEPPRPPEHLASAPPNATKTRSGLSYRVLSRGPGKTKPKPNDRVEVQYSAWTSDGSLFDSSVVRGSPSVVPVSRVIPGWSEGLQLMAEGDKAVFWIPPELAYSGDTGGPKGMLVYEVELLKIVR